MAKIGIYSKKVMKHFRHPKNMGRLKNPDGIGKVGNVICGDVLWLYIKVNKNKRNQEIIKDISFETFGCVAAISTSSTITELAKGKTLDQALKISKSQVVRSLGSLPPVKLHCSVLAVDALAEAVYDYLAKNKRKIPGELEKRHQMIKKDKETINDRYHDWVELEEKLHQR
jgi:nitrogen fixation NifU-like protein